MREPCVQDDNALVMIANQWSNVSEGLRMRVIRLDGVIRTMPVRTLILPCRSGSMSAWYPFEGCPSQIGNEVIKNHSESRLYTIHQDQDQGKVNREVTTRTQNPFMRIFPRACRGNRINNAQRDQLRSSDDVTSSLPSPMRNTSEYRGNPPAQVQQG